MKILYISNSAIPSKTANSIHVMKMAQAFAENGHDVELLAPKVNDQDEKEIFDYYGVKDNFTLVRLTFQKLKIGTLFSYAKSIYLYLKNKDFDLAYGRFLHGCFIACVVLNKRTFFEVHAPYAMFSWYEKILFNIMIKHPKFQKLVVISDALKQMYISSNILYDNKILVAHDGADRQPDFEGVLPQTEKTRVGYFGHLYKGRGIDIIIQLAQLMPEIEFHVVGGNEHDIAYWKSQTNAENLIFHGFVEPKLVYKYRNSCDILLAPYQKEVAISGGGGNTSAYMSPLKLFEYMSTQKAIIVSDLPVLREVLNKENAILVQYNNVQQWGNAILDLCACSSKKNTLAKKAFEQFSNKFTWQRRAKFLLEGIAI